MKSSKIFGIMIIKKINLINQLKCQILSVSIGIKNLDNKQVKLWKKKKSCKYHKNKQAFNQLNQKIEIV